MNIFPLRRRTYFALYLLCIVGEPVAAFASQMFFGVDWFSHDGLKLALITLLWLVPLTYPLGILPTLLSWIVSVNFGWMTPFGSVLFLVPLYAAAGYLQWYVLIPKYFSRIDPKSSPVRGEPVEP